jgi:aspartyl-tRNA(Asn)/glutamyl-tRNA(Gln) amidotransferase subunit A
MFADDQKGKNDSGEEEYIGRCGVEEKQLNNLFHMSDFSRLTIKEAHQKLKNKEVSARELTEACLAQIHKLNDQINAFVHLNEEYALARADQIDREGNFDHPLKGIPCSLKDVFCSEETKTTGSSKILEGFTSPYIATTVQKLLDAGAIILGKVNTDEFTMGASSETSFYGSTKNPWDLTRVAGGSSGGSAASVATDMCFFSLGTDTGGSIRLPAAFCGVTGLKVTYGRTSRFGVMSMSSSIDTIGPICKNVEDAALVLQTIAGRDPYDSTTPDVPVPDYSQVLNQDIRGMRIGIPKEYFIKGIDPEVEQAVSQAIEQMKDLGAEIIEVSLPHTKYVLPVYYVIVSLEVSSNMARYDGIRFGLGQQEAENLLDHYFQLRSRGFGREVKRRIMIGTYIHSLGYDGAYYIKAQKVRTLLKRDFQEVFSKVNVIMSPISPVTAFKIGEKTTDPVRMYLMDIFTASVNLVGIPGISVPCGFIKGLPVGLQFMGPQFGEDCIFKAANAYQRATKWHLQKPALNG